MNPHRRLVKLQRRILTTIRADVRKALGPQRGELKKYYASYKREFQGTYRTSSREELLKQCIHSQIILMGDYHSFSKSQKAALDLLEEIHNAEVPLALGLEMVRVEHQEYVDAFLAGKLREGDLLEKIDYERTWGFPWEQFRPLLHFAKENSIPVVALNTGASRLLVRDQQAAEHIAEFALKNPTKKLFVLYGDLHMARGHIPRALRRELKNLNIHRKTLVILQNSESLYWRLSSNNLEHKVDVVSLGRGRFCIMNAAPWVKLQSYLQWAESNIQFDDSSEPNLHDLAHARLKDVLQVLGMSLPEQTDFTIKTLENLSDLEQNPVLKNLSHSERRIVRHHILGNRTIFIPQGNLLYLASASMNALSEGVTMLAHAILSKRRRILDQPETDFFASILVWATAYFGSKLLNHKRKCDLEDDYRMLLSRRLTASALPQERLQRQVARLVLRHLNAQRTWVKRKKYRAPLALSKAGGVSTVPSFIEATRCLGGILGEKLFVSYTEGKFDHGKIEDLMFTNVATVDARKIYLDLVGELASSPLAYTSKKEIF